MTILQHNFNEPYEKLLNKHLSFIEKQSFKIVKNNFGDNDITGDIKRLEIENRALELSNMVIDTLKSDEFKILRNFNGKSKVTTYLTVIISRKFVDIVRKKMGRSREKERAKEFGEIGLRIYKHVFVEKNTAQDFFNSIKNENEAITMDEIHNLINKIKGKKKFDKNDIDNFPESPAKKGIIGVENEVIITDRSKTPENKLIDEEQSDNINKNIKLVLTELTAEEKFILKLRFYNDSDDRKGAIENIAGFLNIDRKAVYKRIDRILKKSKKILIKNGIKANELY